jgi:zinc and cadmium transporter
VTAVAITAHEVPQELGDLAVLLHSGMAARRAMWFNMLTSLTSVAGGLVGYFALSQAFEALPYALAIAAASLIYVAVADLIPGLHKRVDPESGVAQVTLIGLGVAVICVVEGWLG